jgi:vitamin B12 transporter
MRNRLILTLLAASALSAPAFAQEAEENIVVTATRTQTSVRDLPADITVIDVDAALSRGQTTLSQVLEDTPGLGVVQAGGIGQQTSLFAGGTRSPSMSKMNQWSMR